MQARQVHDDAPEGGGVLLDRLILNTDDVVVDEITLPRPADNRARFWFRRSRQTAQARVVAAAPCAVLGVRC